MYRGTTPTIPIKIKNVDLSEAKLFLTFESPARKQITLKCPGDFTVEFDGTDTVGDVTLTQQQTLALSAQPHKVQIRWITAEEVAGATKEQTINVNDVLLKELIHYEE